MTEYTIRQYRPEDTDDFLELYGEVMGTRDRGREWFTWKYEDNPYVDHVPMTVAEHDGTLVGARPFFAMKMAAGGQRHLALQPGDTMVHPDHRRNGLFTRMTERAIDRYEDQEPAFFFNFPNERSLGGYRKLGWERVGTLSRYYRPDDPEALVDAQCDSPGMKAAGSVGVPLMTGYTRLRERLAAEPKDVAVQRESTVPAADLASIYHETAPGTIHAVRDEPFYQWRFDNPDWEYTTYLAADETGRAGMVVATSTGATGSGVTATRIVDAVPLNTGGRNDRMVALLDRVLSDRTDADLFVAPSSVLSPSVLRSFGFHGEGERPLSYVRRGRAHVARDLGEWEIRGRDIRDEDNWTMTFAELDTS